MSEPPRDGENQRDREARVLKSVLEAGIVPDNKLGKVKCYSKEQVQIETRVVETR